MRIFRPMGTARERQTGCLYSIDMSSISLRYRCRACGSASYQRLTHRTASGAMGYSGQHRCSGCSLTFATLQEWQGEADADAVLPARAESRHTPGAASHPARR